VPNEEGRRKGDAASKKIVVMSLEVGAIIPLGLFALGFKDTREFFGNMTAKLEKVVGEGGCTLRDIAGLPCWLELIP
jgi:hypothetical protein